MPHGISITVPRSDEKRYGEENPSVKCNICGYVLWVDDIIPEATAMTSSARHERDLNVFNELKGVLVDGCSLEIADLLAEALELLEVPGVAFLWDFADPNFGLAHGWHLVRQVGNEWYHLSDDFFDFLQGSGDGPGEVSSVGRRSDLIPGPAVRGTRASFTVN